MKLVFTLLALLAASPTQKYDLNDTIVDEELLEQSRETFAEMTYNRAYDKYYAWQIACDVTGYACARIEIPGVKYVKTRIGLYGYYEGGTTVFISNRLYGYQRKATLIHEMIHYLHVAEDKIEVPGFSQEICWSENEAFTLTDTWWVSIGRPEMQRGPDWWKPYWHCHPYYNPNWDVWEWIKLYNEGI